MFAGKKNGKQIILSSFIIKEVKLGGCCFNAQKADNITEMFFLQPNQALNSVLKQHEEALNKMLMVK